MSLVNKLLEISDEDKEIIKSFKSKDSLSDLIFEKLDGEFFMRKDVRKSLCDISDDFLNSLGVEFFIHDITLTGSLANYNWSKYSDVDLHILIDFQEIENKKGLELIFKEFFDAKKNVWNSNHDVKIKGFDVELYVQDVNEEHSSSGVYSILNNKWLIKPTKGKESIDEKKIIEKSEYYIKKIDKLVEKSKNQNVKDDVDSLKNKLKDFRKSGLERGGEYSYENLVFKLLRRNGYVEKLLDIKKQEIDKKLSLKQ
jgi:hypothetical protein